VAYNFTFTYVYPNIAGMLVGEHNTHPFSGHWHGDNKLILSIFTSSIDTTIFSILNTPIPSVSHSSHTIGKDWGSGKVSIGNGGLHRHNVTGNFDNKTAAGWI